MESNPDVAKFTASVEGRIVSENGAKCSVFEAGETVLLHRDLWKPAMSAGLVPEGELAPQEEPEPAHTKSKEEQIHEGLVDAVKTLIVRGDTNSFTQLGRPRTASVKKLVDFDFKAKDVDRAFEQAMFEVEQYGDNSQEHSESSSDATE